MSVERILIIADDLTGACDSGVAFLSGQRRVRVMLGRPGVAPDRLSVDQADFDVLALTTETRDVAAGKAGELVGRHMAALEPLAGGALLFKKVDSAARGNFAVEVLAALDASRAAIALVAPAFPAAGRTVEDGTLTVRDWSGQNTKVCLPELFASPVGAQVEVLPAGSKQQLKQGIERATSNSKRVLLCDAVTQDDLERLVDAGMKMSAPLLWAGSAGLAHALAGKLPMGTRKSAVQMPQRKGRTMLFVGTPHPVTQLQIAQLEGASSVIGGAIHRIPEAEASEEQVVSVFGDDPVGALILTGGDTASFVLRALGATSIALAGEIDRGIPWGWIEGGMAHGCVVVTKSGGFGERDALVRAFEFCERRLCDPA